MSPTYIAAQNGHASVIAELAKHKVNFNQANHLGSTPAYIAVTRGHAGVIAELEKYSTEAPAFVTANKQYTHVMTELKQKVILKPVSNALIRLHDVFLDENYDCRTGYETTENLCSNMIVMLINDGKLEEKIARLNALLEHPASPASIIAVDELKTFPNTMPDIQKSLRTMANALSEAATNPKALEHTVTELDALAAKLRDDLSLDGPNKSGQVGGEFT